ncbi:uncharacterized protein LOC132197611 [Neocloeon triangulifer]|uniref:uncharacterized protein LOC132197611 n=1 Tax=Neocloeon triangulifer TaxID=2078957 RepID=UPI00286F420E|nr:uncharacterized protein LOC132197611 [Neocloeon triangulifer]
MLLLQQWSFLGSLLLCTTTATIPSADIDTLLREGMLETNVKGEQDYIVLVGGTGSGKSSLSKFIRKDESMTVVLNKQSDFILTDKDVKIGSEKSHASKTFYPNIDKDLESGVLMIDCAGFEDTRSATLDFVASFLNRRLLNSARRLKIIIVENYGNLQLNNYRSGFSNILKHLVHLIGSNIDSFQGAIGLIATKIDRPRKSDAVLLETLSVFIRDTRDFLLDEQSNALSADDSKKIEELELQIKLTDYLLEGNYFGLFRRPEELGSPWKSAPMNRNYILNRNLLFKKLNFSLPFQGEFSVAVAPTTVIYINEHLLTDTTRKVTSLYNDFRKEISKILDSKMNEQPYEKNLDLIVSYCKTIIEHLTRVKHVEDLEYFFQSMPIDRDLFQDIIFQIYKMHFLFEVIGKSVGHLEGQVENMFGAKNEILFHFEQSRDFHNFCKRFIAEFDTYTVQAMAGEMIINKESFDLWKISLGSRGFSNRTALAASNISATEEIIKKLNRLVSNLFGRKTSMKLVSGVATITGEYLVLSHFSDQLQLKDSIQEIALIATKKVFIDFDVLVLNNHLTIASPSIEIVNGEKKIYMKGEDGLAHERTKAARNLHGANGRNGYSSGKLTIASLNIVNPQLLKIHSAGGSGSRGQDGGDGFTPILPTISELYGLQGRWQDIRTKVLSAGVDNYDLMYLKDDQNRVGAFIKVLNVARGIPTNGGDGGDGGFSAKAGPQSFIVKNRTSIESVKIIRTDGLVSLAGKAGAAGKAVNSHAYRKYFCTSNEIRINSNFWFMIYLDKFLNLRCSMEEHGLSSDKTPEARVGKQGKKHSILHNAYKQDPEYDIFRLIDEYCSFAVTTTRSVDGECESHAFLEYLVTDNVIISMLNIEIYTKFLERLDTYLQESNKIGNVEAVYFTLYRSFKMFMTMCSTCDPWRLKAVDLLFISRLSYLQTFSIGHQIIHLPSTAAHLQKKLSKVKESLTEILVFNSVDKEIQDARKEIEKAGEMIEKKHKKEVVEIQGEIDANFKKLLQRIEDFHAEYEANIENLYAHKKEVKKAMKVKIFCGVLNVVGQIAGAFYPPAAIAASAVNEAGKALSKTRNMDLKAAAPNRPISLKNAMSVISKYKEQKKRDERFRQKEQIKALEEIIETEQNVGLIIFNDEEQRETVKKMVFEYKAHNVSALHKNLKFAFDNIPAVIDMARNKLQSKIDKTEMENGSKERIDKMKNINKNLNTAKQFAVASGAVIDMAIAYANDTANLKRIANVIESNKEAIQEMNRYEQSLNDQFMPMLNDMLGTFNDIQSGLKDDDAVMLQFRKVDVKKYARKFIALINEFTKGFVDESDYGIGIAFVHMEEYMSLLIDAYDKLSELEYRVQLKGFLGRIHGGDCSRTEQPRQCTDHQALAAELEANEVFRKFLYIFTAYQQSVFPFGGSKTGILQYAVTQLKKTPNLLLEEKAKILQDALQLIIDDLNEMQDTISNANDKSVVLAEFNSKYTSSRPFFTWPNSKFSAQIGQLLRGEQVTLVASVLGPGVKNAAKFKTLLLNVTSADPAVTRAVHELLTHFQIEMVHLGESHYRCGDTYYVIGSDPLNIRICYENTERGASVCRNTVFEKVAYGDVPLSPYTVWKFQLLHRSNTQKRQLLVELQKFANSVDLELVGAGFFVEDDAAICEMDLGQYYQYFSAA